MPANYKIIGNRIQQKRKAHNITQEQMAEHLNVTPGYISQIERGVTKINLDTLSSICDVLKCDMTDFIYNSNPEANASYEDDIFSYYEQLTPTERRMLHCLLKTYIDNKK